MGERVFDIECCRATGDVWIATNAGLTRFSPAGDRWRYYTRAEGLPSDQVEAIAFDEGGNLYAGTQCDGVANAQRADDYASWRTVRGGLSEEGYRRPSGSGIPSGQINDLLVARDGTVYVATTLGLAKSTKEGRAWEYLRGRDYDEKARGRREPPPKSWKPANDRQMSALLPEDYVTCLAEDEAGRLWAGFRQQGFAVADGKRGFVRHGTKESEGLGDNFVTAVAPLPDGRAAVGTYGGGLKILDAPESKTESPPADTAQTDGDPPPLPEPARHPTAAELQELAARIESPGEDPPATWAATLGEDWTTQGNWVGRYGRQFAVLCAVAAPAEHEFCWDLRYRVEPTIGPHHTQGDELRNWVHWLRKDDPRVLYNPVLGYRRQADWDDHAEAYPMSHEGPDMWLAVTVPEGVHRLAAYFFNKDGHDGHNRYRDYLLEVRPYHRDLIRAERLAPLAQSRVREFWGGVHKQFLVRGPGRYWLKIARNDSFNTIVSGVFLDRVLGPDDDYAHQPLLGMGETAIRPRPLTDLIPPGAPASPEDEAVVEAAADVCRAADARQASAGGPAGLARARTLAYCAAAAHFGSGPLLERWRWDLGMWTPRDRTSFRTALRKAAAPAVAVNR